MTASGTGLKYQWQTKTSSTASWADTSLNGNTTSTLSFASATNLNGRQYRCIVTDQGGNTATSNAAILTILDPDNIPSALSFEYSGYSLFVGESVTLYYYYSPDEPENNNVIWETSDAKVVSVDTYGTVSAVSNGTATVTVTSVAYPNLSASILITVTPDVADFIPVTDISLSSSAQTVAIGGTNQNYQQTVTYNPSNATNKSVTWTSSNTSIATVNSTTGIVTGVAGGSATITATAADGSGKTNSYKVYVVGTPTIKLGSTAVSASTTTTWKTTDALTINWSGASANRYLYKIITLNEKPVSNQDQGNNAVTTIVNQTSASTTTSYSLTATQLANYAKSAKYLKIWVQSLNSSGDSHGPSAWIGVELQGTLPAPTGVKVDATTSNAVSVTYNSVSGASGHYMYYSTSSTFSTSHSKVDASNGVGYVSGLTAGKTYYFWIAAHDANGNIGTASSRVSTITGSVSGVTLKNGSTTYIGSTTIDYNKSNALTLSLSSTNSNGTYEVKAFVMSKAPAFNSTDANYATEYLYGSASSSDTWTSSTIPFNFSSYSDGQYVKIWVAARDTNYATNKYVTGIQFGFKLVSTPSFITPLTGITSRNNGFGSTYANKSYTYHNLPRKYHLGIDYAAASGTEIKAFANGTVKAATWDDANGYFVVIQHTISSKTVYSFYAHLASTAVSSGQSVTAGNKIGVIGKTGSAAGSQTHLHFSVVDKLDTSGSYYGYSTEFTGHAVNWLGTVFYDPDYIIQYGTLPSPVVVAPTGDDPPSAPTQNNPTASGNSITVSWNTVTGATGYTVYYGTSNNISNASSVSVGNYLSKKITGLNYNTTYYTWVKASNDAGTSDASSSKSVKTESAQPDPYGEFNKTKVTLKQGETATFTVSGGVKNSTNFVYTVNGSRPNGSGLSISSWAGLTVKGSSTFSKTFTIDAESDGDFYTAGTYTLKLWVRDSNATEAETVDTMTVVVEAADPEPEFLSDITVSGGTYAGDTYTMTFDTSTSVSYVVVCYTSDGNTYEKADKFYASRYGDETSTKISWSIHYQFEHTGNSDTRTVILRCYDDNGEYNQKTSKSFTCKVKEPIAVPLPVSNDYKGSDYYTKLVNTLSSYSGSGKRELFVRIALSQVGYTHWTKAECYDGAGDGKTGVSVRYSEYGRWAGANDNWCAAFVSWCAGMAGISTNVIPKTTGAGTFRTTSKAYKLWDDSFTTPQSVVPERGDLVLFMPYSESQSKTTMKYYDAWNLTSHVAIITNVAKSGSTYKITIVEGNSGGKCTNSRSFLLTDTYSSDHTATTDSDGVAHILQMIVKPIFPN